MTTFEQALAGGVGVQPVRFRFERRTKANVFISDDIDAAVRRDSTSIEMDITNAAVRTCSMSFDIAQLPSPIDFAVDHVAIFMDVLVNGVFAATQIGLFRIEHQKTHFERPTGGIIEADGSDVAYHLLRAKNATPTTVTAGTNIMDAVRAEIEAEGLVATAIPVVSLVLPVDRTWGPNTSRWDRIVDLCRSINYYDPWARADGSFTSKERVDPSTEVENVAYSTVAEPRMVLRPYDKESDEAASGWNRYAVLIDHPTRTPEYALRQNNDPTSAVSTVATGIVTSDEYSNDLMYDVTIAGQYAAFELQAAASLANLATLQTALDPRRDAHETYLLIIDFVEASTRWRQVGWKFPVRVGGVMEHNLASAAPVVIDVGTP